MAKKIASQLADESKPDSLWILKFSIEAAARYHEARRARLETYVAIVKIFSIVGAVLAIAFVSGSSPEIAGLKSESIVALLGASIAFVNLVDLVFGVDTRARLHTDLYRRFKALQENIARGGNSWQKHLHDWEGDAQAIRIDEPPLFYALYVEYWNLAVEKFGADKGYMRSVSFWQRRFRHFRHYQPKDFPAL